MRKQQIFIRLRSGQSSGIKKIKNAIKGKIPFSGKGVDFIMELDLLISQNNSYNSGVVNQMNLLNYWKIERILSRIQGSRELMVRGSNVGLGKPKLATAFPSEKFRSCILVLLDPG